MKRSRQERSLSQLSLEELMRRYPEAWARTGEALTAALATGRAESVDALLQRARAEANAWRARVAASRGNPQVLRAALPHLAAERMGVLAAQRTALAAAVGKTEGTYRLSLWSGALVQLLLFRRGLERKPVSLKLFRALWPLVGQRRLLMPLVQQRGIYCFYSRELVAALAGLVGTRPCLELGAGDGTLARFLRAAGVALTAVDDQSWSGRVTYPEDVEKLDARAALAKYSPRAVVCSWPPPGNTFERLVFKTPSVELYVVIGSRHRFAAGDALAYERQDRFVGGVDEGLSSLVLPPELDPAVLVFRRRSLES